MTGLSDAGYLCPLDRMTLRPASEQLVNDLNRRIRQKSLKTLAGLFVSDPLDLVLVHPSGRRGFPVREEVPVLRIDQALAIAPEDCNPGLCRKGLDEWRKMMHEFDFWYGHVNARVPDSAEYVKVAYLKHFGYEYDFYRSKRILDVGCGPCGTLEWADNAALRVGLDPLATAYRQLGTAKHRMSYVCADAERIPFPDGYFHVVACFNALDHVAHLDMVISELQRVVAPGGTLLLVTDIHDEPTPCEPIVFGWDIIKRFSQLEISREEHLEKQGDGVYDSLTQRQNFDHENHTSRYGMLTAVLTKPQMSLGQAGIHCRKPFVWGSISEEGDLVAAGRALPPVAREIALLWSQKVLEFIQSDLRPSDQLMRREFDLVIESYYLQHYGNMLSREEIDMHLIEFFLTHATQCSSIASSVCNILLRRTENHSEAGVEQLLREIFG